nr:type I-D CRISPR-associated protein Cas7/Csc2 [Candidatus Njordarchaeota archaeon]
MPETILPCMKEVKGQFEESIPTFFTPRRIQVVVLRETLDPCIFRTDIEGLDVLPTVAGKQHSEIVSRSIIFQRKLVAAERRTGKQLLRSIFENVPNKKKKQQKGESPQCFLNTALCGMCIDCTLFGFTRPEGYVRKSRAEYGTCFSIRRYESIYETFNWNAIQEDTQMPGQAFGEIEVIRPGVVYPSVTTLHSVTLNEFLYYVWCLLNTSRYGATTSRTGRVRNLIAGIIFTNSEIVTSLDLTMHYYDVLAEKNLLDKSVLTADELRKYSDNILNEILKGASSNLVFWNATQVDAFLSEFAKHFKDKEATEDFIKKLESECETYGAERLQ